MTHRVRYLSLGVLVASIVLLADDQKVVFRSEVALARVDVQVVDRNNRAITGLDKSDFVLREDGKIREITNFAREDMPVDVLLLLDVSRSMRPHVQRISEASHEALRALGPNDRVAVMVFDRSSRLRMPFRSNRRDIESGIEQVLYQEDFRGGTDITRGLLDAAAYMSKHGRRDARRAIVILTDDQTERGRDEDRVTRAMNDAGTVLSALLAPDAMRTGRGRPYPRRGGMGSPWPGGGGPLGGVIWGRRGGYPGGPVTIGGGTKSAGTAEIARRTGGDSMRVDDASSFETTLERIRQRYALYFNMPNGTAPADDNIEVELASAARRRYSDAEVHFRRVSMAAGSADVPAPGSEPTEVVTSTPSRGGDAMSDEDNPDAPKYRRRRGVSGDRTDGPMIGGDAAASSSPAPAAPGSAPAAAAPAQKEGGWPRADQPTQATAAAPSTPAANSAATSPAPAQPPAEHKGGWRKLKPGEQP
jgi:VWFA-related protein